MAKWHEGVGIDCNPQETYTIGKIIENLPVIEAWRNGLSEAKQRRYNSPSCVWTYYRKTAGVPAPSASRMHVVLTGRHKGSMHLVSWPGAVIKRAAEALRECRSNDLLVLAKTALEILNRDDLIAALDGGRPATHAAFTPAQAFPTGGRTAPPLTTRKIERAKKVEEQRRQLEAEAAAS